MNLDEAKEIVAEIQKDGRFCMSGPHEYGPSEPRRWRLEGAFTSQQLEALAVVSRETR